MEKSIQLKALKELLDERIDHHMREAEVALEYDDIEEHLAHIDAIKELEWIKKDLGLDLKLI